MIVLPLGPRYLHCQKMLVAISSLFLQQVPCPFLRNVHQTLSRGSYGVLDSQQLGHLKYQTFSFIVVDRVLGYYTIHLTHLFLLAWKARTGRTKCYQGCPQLICWSFDYDPNECYPSPGVPGSLVRYDLQVGIGSHTPPFVFRQRP